MKLSSNEKISPSDLRKNLQFKKFISNLKSNKVYNIFVKNKLILAGGSLVRLLEEQDYLSIHDYDFYFKSKEQIEELLNDIEIYNLNNNAKFKLVCKTENAYTFTLSSNFTFQFITLDKLINNSPMKIIDKFDFSICQIAYDFEWDEVVCSDIWTDDINNRHITFNTNTLYPLSSFVRLNKYLDRGYSMGTIDKLALAFSISQLNIKTFSDVSKQMNGISATVLEDFRQLLMSDEYKNKQFDIMEFIKLYNEYIETLETLESLNE